jgi:hypothetical protein
VLLNAEFTGRAMVLVVTTGRGTTGAFGMLLTVLRTPALLAATTQAKITIDLNILIFSRGKKWIIVYSQKCSGDCCRASFRIYTFLNSNM